MSVCDLQVEDMRGELLRMRQEKTELQRVRLETSHPAVRPHVNHTDREEGRGGVRGPGTELNILASNILFYLYQILLHEKM